MRHIQDVLQWSLSQIQLHPPGLQDSCRMAEMADLQKCFCTGELPKTPQQGFRLLQQQQRSRDDADQIISTTAVLSSSLRVSIFKSFFFFFLCRFGESSRDE